MAYAMTSQMSALVSTPACRSRVSRSAFTGGRVMPALPCLVTKAPRGMRCEALFTKKPEKQQGKSNSTGAFEENPAQPVFSRRREVFVGRLAMFGFASALVGEITTGRGALGQLQLETGLPPYGVDLLVLGIVAYSAIGALNPLSPTWSRANQQDVAKRPAGPNQDPRINLASSPGKFLGITEFGFSKMNEVFVGRVAQLGFVAALIGEKVTGYGPLKQFGLETGIPLGAASFGLLAFIAFLFVAAVFEGNFPTRGDEDKSTY